MLLEDDAPLRRRLAAHLAQLGAEITQAGTIGEARRAIDGIRFDFALLDLHLPDGEALELLREGRFSENTGVVVMTAQGAVKDAVDAMRFGAGDYLSKPFEPEELPLAFLRCRERRGMVRRDEHRTGTSAPAAGTEFFFGTGLGALRARLETIIAADRRLARFLPPVLFEGEAGTGKTTLAGWLHLQGPRASQPFIKVNCSALPEETGEAELFGHERGAVSGAKGARIGLFEAAEGGTLFLDEVAALAPGIQAKVLTAIEEQRIRRLGSAKETAIDVRIMAASNEPAAELVAAGTFREDLFHRLRLLRAELPPLRRRGADILALARLLLEQVGRRHRRRAIAISASGEERILAYPWPGNIRELAHVVESEVIFHGGPALDFASLGEPAAVPPPGWRNPAWRIPDDGFSIDAVITALIDEALRETNHNVSATARRLGVTREYLRYRLSGRGGHDSVDR